MIRTIIGSSTPDSWSWLAGLTNRRIANAWSSTSAKDPKRAFEAPCCDHSTRFFGRLCRVFRSSAERAARDGWSSQIEAVYADPRHAQLEGLNDYRRRIQFELG